MGSSQARPEITSHALSRAHIDTKSLRSEWNAYLRWQGRKHGDALTKKTLWKFVHDMEVLLGLSQLYNVDEMISAELVSFEEFKHWFVQVSQREGFSLSKSLMIDNRMDGGEVTGHVNVQIRGTTTFEPCLEGVDVPPAQIAQREWSLIFNQLETPDLNNVNLVCRFFYCVLSKYPPDAFRLFRVASLRDRTNEHIGASLLNFDRSRTVVRLEVGIFNLGNNFCNADLRVVLVELHNLRFLKLMFCHLLSAPGYEDCIGLKGAQQLESLTLYRMNVPAHLIVAAFPNLRHLVIAGPCPLEDIPASAASPTLVGQLSMLPKLKLLALGDVLTSSSATLGLKQLQDLQLSQLWLEGKNTRDPNRHANGRVAVEVSNKGRNCFDFNNEESEMALLGSGVLASSLREYVSGPERSISFTKRLKERGITHICSTVLKGDVWDFPEMAQYSWRLRVKKSK